MATKKKKYGLDFANDMANDPNMGMNPKWIAKNKGKAKAKPKKK